MLPVNCRPSQLPPLWDAFLVRLHEIENAIPGTCYGALQQLDERDERLVYIAGIEVSSDAALPAGMQEFIVPECTCACFTHRGEVSRLDTTVNYVYSNWLLNSGRQHSSGPDLEIYGVGYHPSSAESVIHYAIPVL